jgi:hypothetical protein
VSVFCAQNTLTLTAEQLDGLCTPCTQKIIIASATYVRSFV